MKFRWRQLPVLLPGLLLAQSNWTVPAEFAAAGYTKEPAERGVLLAGPGPAGALTQTFDATPYRGQVVRLRAALRVEGAGKAQLLLRVDRPGGLGFFDNMGDRPISPAEWKPYELAGEVAADAETIEVGVLSSGSARVGVDAISFEKLPAPPSDTVPFAQAIRDNYARVDAAYAAGDVDAIASLGVPGAQVIIAGARTPLSTALTGVMDQVQKGAKFQSHSVITYVTVAGGEAVVWVNNESSSGAQALLSSSRDTWVRTSAGWRLKESSLLGTRVATPPAILAQIREHAGMPRFDDVRIVLWEGAAAPAIEGFAVTASDADWGGGKGIGIDIRNSRAAAAQALRYLQEHMPEEAGPAEVAFQGDDPVRLSAVVRLFDSHPASDADWLNARQAAMVVYQSRGMLARRDEAMANNAVWLASQAYPAARIVVQARNAAAMAPWLRKRYGKQLYLVGSVPRQLLGGALFLDLSAVPAGSALDRWLAEQHLAGVYDGLAGQ